VVILTNGTVMVVTGLIGREGDAAIAGYGIGSRLEYMLIPISFGIGAALTALVGTNIGARQYHRARHLAWSGALMAGAVAALIGILVAIWPDLWLGLFTADPQALASGRHYLSIVGPAYGFFGVAMALYFASQGTGEMVWPVAANLTRITIAAGGAFWPDQSAGAYRASMPAWRPASSPFSLPRFPRPEGPGRAPDIGGILAANVRRP
jgi:Na+-driven multidrug efflux pump